MPATEKLRYRIGIDDEGCFDEDSEWHTLTVLDWVDVTLPTGLKVTGAALLADKTAASIEATLGGVKPEYLAWRFGGGVLPRALSQFEPCGLHVCHVFFTDLVVEEGQVILPANATWHRGMLAEVRRLES
ncbi:MAG: hypothetical protein H6825_12095 [Planctomycetes bacterium]|nr:hypothetical protein [Planctomycetota bacterium]